MSLALTDRKTNPETYVHPKTQPLRGNQLGQALANAGLVDKPRAAFEPLPVDERRLISDIQVWLTKLVAGERVIVSAITKACPENQRRDITSRLRMRGYIRIAHGPQGGSMATPKLVALARGDVGEDTLRAIALVDLDAHEREEAARIEQEWQEHLATKDAERQLDTQEKPPPLERGRPKTKPPTSPGARQAWMVANLRAWLRDGADGKPLRIAHIGNPGAIYAVAYTIRDAGYIERRNKDGYVWYVVPEHMREHVRSLTDEQIAAFMWPSRGFASAPPPPERESDVGDAPDEEPQPAEQEVQQEDLPEPAQAASDSDALTLIAHRWTQLLAVLERMDARQARIERELGLPPIEQEMSK